MSSIHISPGSYLKNTQRILNVDANIIILVNQQISSINEAIYGYQPTYEELKNHTINVISLDHGLCADVYRLDNSIGGIEDRVSALTRFAEQPYRWLSSWTDLDNGDLAWDPFCVYLIPLSTMDDVLPIARDVDAVPVTIVNNSAELIYVKENGYGNLSDYHPGQKLSGGHWECIGTTSFRDEDLSNLIDAKLSTLVGTESDSSSAGTIWGAKKYAEECADSISSELSNKLDVTEISAFEPNHRLTRITFEDGTVSAYDWLGTIDYQTMIDVGLYDESHGTWLSNIIEVEIGNRVSSIWSSAFSHCSSLVRIEIPNSVKTIGASTFSGCSNLASITIPDSVTNFEASTFANCTRLSFIAIPNSVSAISPQAFKNCSNLKTVSIGSNVTRMGRSAFSGCSSLNSVTIPVNLTNIGRTVFSDCSSLTSLIFEGKTSAKVFAMDPGPSDWGIDPSIISTWNDASQEWVNEQGFLKKHQSLTAYAQLSDIVVPPVSSVNGLVGNVVLSAENISSGVFSSDRIPDIAISKVSGLQSALDSKVSAISMNGSTKTLTNGIVDLGKVLSNTTAPTTDVALSGNASDAYDTGVALSGKASKEDVALNAPGFSEWTILRDGMDVTGSLHQPVFDSDGYWMASLLPEDGTDFIPYSPGENDALYIEWEGINEISPGVYAQYTATRTALPGYVLGPNLSSNPNFDKPLQPAGDYAYLSDIVSAISMNGEDPITATNGVVDLGTVLTEHQSLSDYVRRADLSTAIVSALSVGTDENDYNYTTAGTDYTPTTISAAVMWSRKLHQAFINVLNAISCPPSEPTPPLNPRTIITFDDGTVSAYNWSGTIVSQTMIDAGLVDVSDYQWLSSIVDVEIGTDVTSIGDEAFSRCSRLMSVTIGNGVTSIGVEAFSRCSGLTTLTIPDSVTNIEGDAFSDCSALTSLIFEGKTLDEVNAMSPGPNDWGIDPSIISVTP